jgi:NCAIR mutase (PurE)-related protein
VTQTRAGASPLDHLFGPPPGATAPAADEAAAESADTAPADSPEKPGPAVRVAAVQPSPLDDAPSSRDAGGGFAPLLLEPQPVLDPPLSLGGPEEPLLGPVPGAPRNEPAVPGPVSTVAPVEPALPAAPAAASVEPEVIWGTGRSTAQILALVREARREFPDRPALVLRASAETLVALAAEHDAYTTMDAAALAAAVGPLPEPAGRVRVLCAGGGDAPVAAEAAFVARVSGTEVARVDDITGSRTRSLLADGTLLADADCLIVVAGMDASLATLVGSMTDVPVVAVPTSAGQPGAFGGLGALMTMLNSAAPGVTVSNIDNGYSAGVFAARIARRAK